MNRDEKLMKVMRNIIIEEKKIDRATLMKRVGLSINQYNRIKSHFEERFSNNVIYDKSEKTWRSCR